MTLKKEYVDIIREITGVEPNYPDTELFLECKNIFCNLEQKVASRQFKRVLKKYRRNDNGFINELPKSMKNLGISFKIDKKNKIAIECGKFLVEEILENTDDRTGLLETID